MSLENSVTDWIEGIRQGDSDSAQKLWERYFQQLLMLANARLPIGVRRGFDEEDVALSAFHSLCRGAKQGNFPDLEDRDQLWSLLVVITTRKALQQVRKSTAARRGGGKVRGESVFDGNLGAELEGIAGVIGKEPTPEFVASMSEEFANLLDLLPDDDMKQLAILKMEGHTNHEVAAKLGCGLRTVERRLGLIREIWRVRG